MIRAGGILLMLALALVLGPGARSARAQLPPKPSAPPGASPGPNVPADQQPISGPFSPFFGPYTAPPSETPAAEAGRQPFRRSTGRAQSPEIQTERLLLTPSFFVDEAWTDNVFLDNTNKQADFITQFTPGLQLAFREPGYGLAVGYVFTSEIYAKLTELNAAQARQAATLAGFYEITPQLKFRLQGAYLEDNNTTSSGIAGLSTGRTASRGGIVTPGLIWTLDPLTTVQAFGSWYTQRFDGTTSDGASSYDTYTFTANAARSITPLLTALGSYQFLRSNVSDGDDAEYHLLQLGAQYQISPSLVAQLLAGPQITTIGDAGTTFAVQVGATQQLSTWGSVAVTYTRVDQPNGGLGGTSETNTVSASLAVTDALLRNLTVRVGPIFTTANSGNGEIDSTSIGLAAVATYPIARWMLATLGYTYFAQRSSGSSLNNINANRVTVGLELFYPVRLH